jgi:hypothetical protein
MYCQLLLSPWSDGREENFYTANSSASPDPFSGGDKQIKNLKELFDSFMTEFKLLKGTPFWYSESPGSISKTRQDLANTAFTGKGRISHDETFPGQMNWNSDIYLNFIGGRLRYAITANELSADITLANNEVAYLELVRDVNIIPNLEFINGSTYVKSANNVAWTALLQSGDFIKDASKGDGFYYEIDSVDSAYEVTLKTTYQEDDTGASGIDAQYAFGVYSSDPDTDPNSNTDPRNIKVVDRGSVPFGEDYFWLFFRQDDEGSVPKVYVRVLGGQELEQGEEQEISDNTSLDILNYIGSASETDNSPDYLNAVEIAVKEVTTFTIPDAAAITSGQYFTINSASDQTQYYVWYNKDGAGGDPTPTGLSSIEVPISTGNSNLVVAAATHAQVDAESDFDSVDNLDGTITVTNADFGATTDAANVDVGGIFAVSVDTQGVGEVNHYVIDDENLTRSIKRLDQELFSVSSSLSASQEIIRQNENLKLVAGGTWSWDLTTTTLSWSSDAKISIGSVSDARNNIIAGSTVLASDGDVAYVEVNRIIGPAENLTVNVSSVSSLVLTDDTLIIARRVGDDVIVGTSSFALKDREFLELDGALAEINRYNGQLAMTPEATISTRIEIAGSDIAKLSGSKLGLEQKSLLLDFEGAIIDFQNGLVRNAADTVTLQTFTPATIGANEYFFYSLTLLPDTVNNTDNTITGQILILPASASNAVLDNAPKAPFPSSGIKLGNVYVKENGAGGIENINYENIIQLSVGGSGSGGTGDANELLERLKNRLANYGAYEYMTPVIFSSIEEDLTNDSNTTAAFDIVNANYEFSTIGTAFESVQLLDAEFLTEEIELNEIELIHYWNLEAVDTAATYEVSRDGGNEWQTVTMARIGSSDTYRGTHTFAEEAANSFSQTEGTLNGTYTDLTDLNELSRQFVLANTTTVKKITASINKTAAATGYVFAVAVKDDGGGLPSTDPLDEVGKSRFVSIDGLVAGAQSVDFEIRFTAPAETYHIVFKTDILYKTEYTNSAGANKIAIEDDGSNIVYTLEGLEPDLRVRITSGTDNVASEGFGVFYKDDNKISPVDGNILRNVSTFVGDVDNLDTFTLTFLPDPRLLHVYELGTGQVYRYGAFVIQGYDVIFEPNTFDKPDTVSLEFLQIQGGSFDNSDKNGSLLAANFLGSTDANIDLSVAGRGVFLRRPDGTLREIAIDDSDNIVIYSV